MLSFAIAMFAAVLSPSSAAGYKYTVPNPVYANLVNGVGTGDTATFGPLRYTDVVWLSNAIREFSKVRHDIFYTGRTSSYQSVYQITNAMTRVLMSPYHYIPTLASDEVNFGTGTDHIPKWLDENKDISFSAVLPTNFNGSVAIAYPVIANVSQDNAWKFGDRLFTDSVFGYTNRFPVLSTIANAYASLAELHTLKLINYDGAPSAPYSGWRRVDSGTNTAIDYYTESGDEDQNWIQDGPTTTTNWYGNVQVGYFQYVGYHYSSKTYRTSSTTNGLTVSPLCSDIRKFDIYTDIAATSAIPQTLVIAQPIEKVWIARNSYFGSDMSWLDRMKKYTRVSLFKVDMHFEETLPATGAHSGQTTNGTETAYVLKDTSDDGDFIPNTYTNSYVGEFDIIRRGLVDAGSTNTLAYFKSLLTPNQLTDLNRECQPPREPQDDGYGNSDYIDVTTRTIWYKVSYLWSLTTIKPTYTCTFDGK